MQSKKAPKKTATTVEKGTVAKQSETGVVENAPSPRPAKATKPKATGNAKAVSAAHKHKAVPAEKALAAAVPSSATFSASVEGEGRATVSQEDIAKLAHSYWLQRGEHGSHEEDWFRAEQELLGI